MAILGNNILIFWNDSGTQQLIAGTRSNEIVSQADSIEIASATQQEWEEIIAGRKSWSFSTAFLLLTEADVEYLLKAGMFFTIQVCGRNAGAMLQGRAMLQTAKYTMTEATLANGTFQFKGSGPLEVVTTPSE